MLKFSAFLIYVTIVNIIILKSVSEKTAFGVCVGLYLLCCSFAWLIFFEYVLDIVLEKLFIFLMIWSLRWKDFHLFLLGPTLIQFHSFRFFGSICTATFAIHQVPINLCSSLWGFSSIELLVYPCQNCTLNYHSLMISFDISFGQISSGYSKCCGYSLPKCIF